MDKPIEAPTTPVPVVAPAPLVNVGDALDAVTAKNRKAFIATLLNPEPAVKGPDPEPEVQTPATEPAEQSDLSQDAPADEAAASPSPDSVPEPESPPAEPDATEADDTEDEPHWEEPAWVEKWKGKEIAKRKQAETEAEQLRVRVAELEANTATAAPPPDVLNTDPEVKAAQDEEAKALSGVQRVRELQTLLRRDPEAVAAELTRLGMTLPDTDAETLSFTLQDLRETMHEMRVSAMTTKRIAEQRAQQRWQGRLQQAFTEAVQVYPWMQDPKSPQYVEGLKVLKEAPWIKSMPNGYLALGDFIEGRRLREQRAAASSKPAPAARKRERPPNIPAPRSAPPARATNPTMVTDDIRSRALLGNDPQARKAIVRSLLGQR